MTGSNSEPIELEHQAEIFRSFSMDSEPSVNQDTDLEIEGVGMELDNIDPGMVECVEVEEEEDVNGDVIRCLCNETEEGGFMIQVRESNDLVLEAQNNCLKLNFVT